MPPSHSRSEIRNGIRSRLTGTSLLSVKELAEVLQVPVRTIYDWRYRGLGPTSIRLGRHVRYEPIEIERWLNTQKRQSQPFGY
jgi:excisionase family DNA binding protein